MCIRDRKSINQDMPDTYHIYFGDQVGSAGTAMTFFGWPTWPKRRAGSGQITTVSFSVPPGSLDFWKSRLRKLGVEAGATSRFGTDAVVVSDPDAVSYTHLDVYKRQDGDRDRGGG